MSFRKDNGAEVGDVVIGVLPKNALNEIRITTKQFFQRRDPTKGAYFVDVREHWYRTPTDEPTPTKKGIMVPRAQVHKLVLILLKELQSNEVDFEWISKVKAQLSRLAGEVD